MDPAGANGTPPGPAGSPRCHLLSTYVWALTRDLPVVSIWATSMEFW